MLEAAPTCKRYRGTLFRLASVVGGVATLFFLTANASAGEHQPEAGAPDYFKNDVGNGNGKGPDRLPPTTPLGAAVTSATSTSIDLAWTASTDNVGVAGYGIYVNGSLVGSTDATSFTLTGLSCGSSYTFAVDAYDKHGNRSQQVAFTGSTRACPLSSSPLADTQSPTVPGGLHATSLTATSIAVAWTASTDNVAVAGYGLYRNGTSAGTASSTTAIFSGLSCGTAYTLAVDAYDAASNRSSKASINASTSACPTTSLATSLPARMPESSGSSLYVAAGASGAASCGRADPCSLEHAWALAADGTTIYVHGGQYPRYRLAGRSFSAQNPVTLTSFPGEMAVFVGDSTMFDNGLLLTDTAGVRVRGMTVSYPNGNGLKIDNSANMEVDRMILKDNGGQGLLVAGDCCYSSSRTFSSNVQVWNNTFTNNGRVYPPCPYPSGDIRCNNYIPERHNHSIYYGAAASYDGGVRNGTEGGVIANNVIYDQDSGFGMRIGDAARGLLIVNNTIYHSYVHDPGADPYWGQAINLANSANNAFRTQNVGVYNNIITNSAAGVYGSAIVNAQGNMVDYNMSWSISTTQNPDCSPDCNFDTQYGAYTIYNVGTHNLKGVNPLFVNPSAQNFHLQAGSPALGKANPAYAPAFDADGNPRPAAPALGAFG
jgi:chitodextrinase